MMNKKFLAILVVLMLMAPTFVMAANTNNGTAGKPLEMVGLTVTTSPGVFMYYLDDGSTNNAQWYLISSAHSGGTKFYATAQNSTSIFKMDDETDGITLAELTGLTYPTRDQAASEDYWSDSDSWER